MFVQYSRQLSVGKFLGTILVLVKKTPVRVLRKEKMHNVQSNKREKFAIDYFVGKVVAFACLLRFLCE
jgi:hypothetical protein